MALNIVIAAIIYWNTMYMDKAADHLRRAAKLPDPSLLKHVSPLGWTHINLTGDYVWDSGPLNAQTSAHCTSATRENGVEGAKSTTFAKCSSLALLSEPTLR